MLRSIIAVTAIAGVLAGLSGCGVTQTKEEAKADFCLFHPTTCNLGENVRNRVQSAADGIRQALPE